MARPLQVEGETQPCVIQGAQGGYRRPQNTGLRAGSHGEMRAADLRSAAPAGGAPAQHPEVRTRAPAAPSTLRLEHLGRGRYPAGRASAPTYGAQPAVPDPKTLLFV